jgi:hypothetical protein
MFNRAAKILILLASCCLQLQAQIFYESDPGAVNLTSDGQPMGSDFHFEIGVFTGTFVPTAANVGEWATYWRSAQRSPYSTVSKRFADSFEVTENTAPFTIGKTAYIWGFRGDAGAGEWILFRAPSWTWPGPTGFPPVFYQWFASEATAVIGSINPTGSPYLMKSVSVNNAAPPSTSWAEWQGELLGGVALSAPGDDPDKDGISNLIEYVFGSSPVQANPPQPTSLSITEIAGQRYLQLSIPRRVDRSASLTVEVSDDMIQWNSGAGVTTVVESGPANWVVRDLEAIDQSRPKRFMRLKAALP